METPHKTEQFPRRALYAAAALVVLSLVMAATARLTGYGLSAVPEQNVVDSRDLRFIDRADGAVSVQNPQGVEVAMLPPNSGGFVRGVLRALVRERQLDSLSDEAPFRLARNADGTLTLTDLATLRRIELVSFGPTNQGAFEQLLPTRTAAR